MNAGFNIFFVFKINFFIKIEYTMEGTDFLTMKTTNINLRVSPLLKIQLIERGTRMGINLSDYIGFVLTKEMLGQNDPKESEEYKELMQRHKRLPIG